MPQSAKKPRKKSDRRASEGIYNPIDVHVGHRIRIRRTLLGLTQEGLAGQLGVTFQQVQKYERGANRVSSSRLFDVARALEVPIVYFFEDMPGDVEKKSPAQLLGFSEEESVEYESDPMIRRETLELVRAYYNIPSTAMRHALAEMVKKLSKVTEKN